MTGFSDGFSHDDSAQLNIYFKRLVVSLRFGSFNILCCGIEGLMSGAVMHVPC